MLKICYYYHYCYSSISNKKVEVKFLFKAYDNLLWSALDENIYQNFPTFKDIQTLSDDSLLYLSSVDVNYPLHKTLIQPCCYALKKEATGAITAVG